MVVRRGQAAAAMAQVVEAHWLAGARLGGLVVTRYLHGVSPLARIAVVETGHPVSDAAGAQAIAHAGNRAVFKPGFHCRGLIEPSARVDREATAA